MAKKEALLIIDMQYDFIPPSGSLAVTGGEEIIEKVNALRRQKDWSLVVLSKDWHPSNHVSFLDNHKDNTEAALFVPLKLDNGSEQVMWPIHCVQGSKGSEIHHGVVRADDDVVVYKGTNPAIDSYSAFFDNDHKHQTKMSEILSTHGITHVTVCGLAYDFCVGFTAMDAKDAGFDVTLARGASAFVSAEGAESMDDALKKKGIKVVD